MPSLPWSSEPNPEPSREVEAGEDSSILDDVIRATEESDALLVIDVFRSLAPQYAQLPIEDVGALELLIGRLLEHLYPNLTLPAGLTPWVADRIREDTSAMNRIAHLWEQATASP